MELQPVILSGGAGTRLWPLSRELYPKQLLPLLGSESLLQKTLQRVQSAKWSICRKSSLIIANENHRFMVAEQCRQLSETAKIVLEPFGRNTAPAATLAALTASNPSETLLLLLPADHIIKDVDAFHCAVEKAIAPASNGQMVLFGILPTSPHTGYGYIEVQPSADSVKSIKRFVEKPNEKNASSFIEAGGYFWNSGMFLMRADCWLNAVESLNPEILASCRESLKNSVTDLDFVRLDQNAFKNCPSDSIDYAVMEKLGSLKPQQNAMLVPLDAGWSDLGAWPSVAEQMTTDANGNASKGDVLLENANDCLAWSESRLVTLVGVSNLIVVETPDAILVASKSESQSVKNIVTRLRESARPESDLHRKVYRPWGSYEGVDAGERFQVKRICVNPGSTLSLQKHFHRAEHWVVVTGTAEVTRGEDVFIVTENQSTFIPLGTVHRLKNPGKVMLEMIEVQSGSYLGEDDIVRLDDIYGREDKQS